MTPNNPIDRALAEHDEVMDYNHDQMITDTSLVCPGCGQRGLWMSAYRGLGRGQLPGPTGVHVCEKGDER